MHNYARKMKTHFKNSYNHILNHLRDYVNNPDTDFTRNNKLNPFIVLLMVFKFSDHSIKNELLSNKIIVKRQTLMNAISKFKVSAFRDMFLDSLKMKQRFKTFHGYRLLAVDGTYFNYKDGLKKKRKRFLCVMFYDVLNKYYVDVRMSSIILSEIKHCLDMMKNIEMQSILIMDRGYCSVNLMVHCIENNQLFLVRAKDINSNGLLKKCKFKNKSFDTTYTFHLTRNQTLAYKKIHGYRFLSISSNFLNSLKLPSLRNTSRYCESLQAISALESWNVSNCKYFLYMFRNCTSLQFISLPNSLRYLDENMFKDCNPNLKIR